jgi:hypothetical protein
MTVEEIKELTVESELNESDLIDLLSDANTTSKNADADNQENENLNKASNHQIQKLCVNTWTC